jgi:IS6 family transposase
MKERRPALFRGRHFQPDIIITCVRWYLRFSLSLGEVEELMTERGLSVDHTTIWRWSQKYGPMAYQRLKGKLKPKSTMWHMDETYVRVAGRWMYLFRAVDGHGDTVEFYLSETRDREAAKAFLEKALSNPDNRPPRVFCMDRIRIYPAALRDLQTEGRLQPCRRRTRQYANNRIESDHRSIKRRLRAMQGPRTLRTARRVIQGVEAVHIIRKGQVLGATRTNLATHSIAFALLFGIM